MIFKNHNHRSMRCNLVFTLADIIEAEMLNLKEDLRYDRIGMAYETKRYYNEAMHGLRMFRRHIVGTISEDAQLTFGERADMVRYILWLIIDRTGQPEDLRAIVEHLEGLPSVREIPTEDIKDELFNE